MEKEIGRSIDKDKIKLDELKEIAKNITKEELIKDYKEYEKIRNKRGYDIYLTKEDKSMKLEEAIKNLKIQLEHLKQANECGLATKGEFKEDIQAIEIVLQELENKEKEIQDLKDELQLVGLKVKNKRSNTIGVVLHQWKSGSIAVLERIEPTVINTHDSWKTLEIITDDIVHHKTKKKIFWGRH